MSATTLLTTADAEALYRFPTKTFAAWCREGKIDGARKAGREWLMPKESIDTFLATNPQITPPDRSVRARVPRWLWQVLVVIALLLGLLADVYAVRDIISGGDRTLLWVVVAVLSAGLWVSALIILTAKRRRGIVDWNGDQPVYRETQRYTSRLVRWSSGIAVVAMPALLILGVIGYNVWRVIPPRQTVVLVADFLTPDGRDANDVTEKLVKGMEETLAGHDNIQIKRLNRAITADGGSDEARVIGNRPEHKAAFVIWGDYVLDPDPEVYVHFEALRQTQTFLSGGLSESYNPMQIMQPTMVEFKVNLGQHLGQLIAFASALSLRDAYRYQDAIAFFDTAATAIDHPLGQDMQRAIRLYRGANYLAIGRARDAEPDLRALVPDLSTDWQVCDLIVLAAWHNLGLVAISQGDYDVARQYLQQALDINTQVGDLEGRASALVSLGHVAKIQGDYDAARQYLQQALDISIQIGDLSGQAYALTNLGNVTRMQGDYAATRQYYQQALDMFTQIADPSGQASALTNLGIEAHNRGDYNAAHQYSQRALDMFTQIGDPSGQANALHSLSRVRLSQGDYNAAHQYLQQALNLFTQIGDPGKQVSVLNSLGSMARHQSDYDAARQYLQQALDISIQIGIPSEQASTLNNLGNVAYNQGDYAVSRQYYQQAADLFSHLGEPSGQASTLNNLGNVAYNQGDYAVSRQYYQQALDMFTQLGDPGGQASALGNLSNVASGQGDYAASREYSRQALDLFTQLGDPNGQANILGNLGIVAAELGDYETARSYLEQSANLYQELGLAVHPAVQSALDSLPAP